jgi:hypothetical protein
MNGSVQNLGGIDGICLIALTVDNMTMDRLVRSLAASSPSSMARSVSVVVNSRVEIENKPRSRSKCP